MRRDTFVFTVPSRTLEPLSNEKTTQSEKEVSSLKIQTTQEPEISSTFEDVLTSTQSILPDCIESGTLLLNKLIAVGGAPVSLFVCFGLILLAMKPFIEVLGSAALPVIGLLALSLVLTSIAIVLEVLYDILKIYSKK